MSSGCMFVPNVEVIRPKDGAAPAPQEACRTKGSDPMIGSARISSYRFHLDTFEEL